MIDKIVLFPYYAVLKIRNTLFDKGIRKIRSAEVPVISVGNIAVGGTGKTPHTEMILRELLASEEWGKKRIAVLSRGYKRESRGFQQVVVGGSAAMFGDEPLQIKKKFPDVTVAVDKDRIEGCHFLVHPEELQTARGGRKCWDKEMGPSDIIILDDAFQYRKLAADLNIVLVDYNHPLHKDHLMPLGRLRDLPERIGEADVIIVTKCPQDIDNWQKTVWTETLGIRDYSTMTCTGTSAGGRTQYVFFTYIRYCPLKPVFENADCRYIYSKRMILFSGIAKDRPLRNYLSDKYKIVRRMGFPDHHRFTWGDFRKIQSAVNRWPTAAVATTEKDAQRVLDYNGLPLMLRERMLMIPIRVEFVTEEEHLIFRNKLLSINKI